MSDQDSQRRPDALPARARRSAPPTSSHDGRSFAPREEPLAARALATIDRLRGTISWISDEEGLVAGAETLAEFLGCAPDDLMDAGWLNALDPLERRSAAVEWRRAIEENATFSTQWRFQRSNGMFAPMRITIQPMTTRDDDLLLWLCVAQAAVLSPAPSPDERSIAEADVPARASAARRALDSMADAFFGLDRDGRFVFANKSARDCFVAEGTPLVGRTFAEAVPALCGSPLDEEIQRITRIQTPGIVETLIPKVQTWFEVRSYPTLFGCVIHMRDVAYRRSIFERLDAALKSAETARADAEFRAHELDAIIESLVDGLIVYNDYAKVQWINRAMRALWLALGGDDPATLSLPTPRADAPSDAGQSAAETVRQTLERARQRIMAGESLTGPNAVEVAARVNDETTLELSVRGGPVMNESGEIIGAVETVRDVTAQRQGERERIRTLSFVAHELRTPLTSIKLALDLAIRRFARNIPIEPPALSVALDDIKQIERMVEDLVDAARSDNQQLRLTRERCDIREICAQVVSEQEATTGRLARYTPPSEGLWIIADRIRIHQVLSNFLSNAMRYSPPDAPVDMLLERRGDQVWAGVRDRGPGAPPEAQAKLFQAFYRAPGVQALHGPNVSLGLGLFLCKRLVELHDGQIGFTSEPGEGSLFWFTLSLAPEEDILTEEGSEA